MLIEDIKKQPYSMWAGFEAAMISLNRMLRTCNLTIPINYEPDTERVTVQSKYDGVVMRCDHAGADWQELTFNPGLDDERTERHLACDKCPAWLMETDDGEEWIYG